MRINEYNNLQEFIDEYDIIVKYDVRRMYGIEFIYNNIYYRMCLEPIAEEDLPILNDGRRGKYDVMIVHDIKSSNPKYELIGWYADMEDLLENCIIQDKKFKDVIMDNDTKIVGKD